MPDVVSIYQNIDISVHKYRYFVSIYRPAKYRDIDIFGLDINSDMLIIFTLTSIRPASPL